VEIDLQIKQQLAGLLAKPATVTQADAQMLADLVKAYPYYQPLHLLLAKANLESAQDSHLATAALYNGGALLYQVIYHPESLAIKPINLVGNNAIKAEEISNVKEASTFDEVEPTDEQEVFDEIAEINPVQTPDHITDEQEIFDEIAEIETSSFSLPKETVVPEQEEIFDEIAEVNAAAFETFTIREEVETQKEEDTIPDELAIESIVATDFFAFEQNFHSEPSIENQKEVPQPEEYNMEAEAQTVSKYDDDKLPYTFLWWLAKTRKEHEQIFQPYVTPKNSSNASPGELQQQYVEHIFHLQTPFNAADEASKGPLNKQVAHKGDEIIDTFIKNEPQIRAPKVEQINNENKAKKSAEDHNDLVSETLAAIYIEQMLYHKAIDTYEKLSLKFPEKSRYFADLIQSLEKKI
jgi:hypothetical protein